MIYPERLVELFDELAELPESDPRRARVRDTLVTEHLPVAERIARRFAGRRGMAKEDLVQVATVGLINAVDRFDVSRGSDFLSFAVPTMMGEVRHHVRDTARLVRMPRRLTELHLSVVRAGTDLTQRLGRTPRPSEIAAHLNIGEDEVCEGLEVGNAFYSVSLDQALSGSTTGLALTDTLGVEDADLTRVDDRETLLPLIKDLSERERLILGLRFVDNMTQSQIAQRVGVSQVHISRLLTRALERLRWGLATTPGDHPKARGEIVHASA
ncbi:SigB/SigF/SigG family RNA polymerase sigma factor [Actinophytocola sp.]|uniref:SigB/SigF/SigG family RNA polymerase sigma factor n=1 Tax=Actinophytocola sp. TaxID=1872138 RepID=UPI002ED11890